VRIGVGLDRHLGLPFGELREVAKEAQRMGYDSLWTPAGLVPDPFHICAAWAWDTSLSTGISVVPTARLGWSAHALALQAATVANIAASCEDATQSSGLSDASPRFVLGLGTGGTGSRFWASVGLPDRPVAIMREYATSVRRLLAGQTVSYDGIAVRLHDATLGTAAVPVQVYLAALGPQMLQLAGVVADGVLINWSTAAHIAESRRRIAEAAVSAGRDPATVAVGMYIRVCVDDDVEAARRTLGTQVLNYALSYPDRPKTTGHRGLFGRMGFEGVLSELEARRARGDSPEALVDAMPDELLHAVGFYGPAAEAPAEYARLAAGLDESMVRVLTVRRGDTAAVIATLAALNPPAVRASAAPTPTAESHAC
jgi:5,10-methylenetetrahydromethanopterin reductase